MKIKMLLISAIFLGAESFNDLVKLINNSNIVKIYEKNIELQKEKLKEAKAKNLGKLDLEYNYLHFFNEPVMKMDTLEPVGVAGSQLIYQSVHTELPMGSKNTYVGSLIYSYPIFTGFAVSEGIEIQKLNLIKSKLKLNNIKRNLLLSIAKLYAGIYALNKQIEALNKAKNALLSAKEKAKALYKEGLINKSTLDEIDAKFYEIDAKIREIQTNKNSFYNTLSYLVNKKIISIGNLPNIALKKPNFFARPDIKELETTLNIAQNYINLAKSNLYPKIYFQTGIKKEATNIALSKNDYQNVDKSFVALSIQYNIFNGGGDKAKINEAKLTKLKTFIYLEDYVNKVKTEYKNDLLKLKAFKERLIAAKKEIKARKSYYEYIKAKFSEGLADVTDLNSAIAKLASARAKRDYIKSQIFFYTLKSNIDGGNQN